MVILSVLVNLVNSFRLAEHDAKVFTCVLVGQAHRSTAVSRIEPQICGRSSHLGFVMVIWTVFLPTVGGIITLMNLVVIWVILLFFPAMTIDAAIF